MAFFGAAPFGSLLAGSLAHHIGAPHTVIFTGAFCIVGSLWFTLDLPKVNAVMHPIYREMGLMPAREMEAISADVDMQYEFIDEVGLQPGGRSQ